MATLAPSPTKTPWDRRQGESQIAAIALAHRAGVLLHRGAVAEARSLVDPLLERARTTIADKQVLTQALAYAALAEHTGGDDGAAIERLDELERSTRDSGSIYRPLHVAEAARVCAATGALGLARRLVHDLDVVAPAFLHRVLSARAILAEADGELEDALAGYNEAAARWRDFGNVVEEAHALAGWGRCLLRLDRHAEAAEPLRTARTIFDRLGARTLVAEVDEHLAQARAIA